MTKLFISSLLCLLLAAQTAFGSNGEPGQSTRTVSHGKTGVAYMGSVDVNMYLGYSLRTSHGVIFTDCDVFLGGSAEVGQWLIGPVASVSAYSKWFWPHERKLQGFVGLEAGVTRAFGQEADQNGMHQVDPGWAPNISPEVGLGINFNKVSLNFSLRFPQLIYVVGRSDNFMTYLPMLSIGISF